MDDRQFMVDFIEGRVSPAAFETRLNDDGFMDWLQGIVPENLLWEEAIPLTPDPSDPYTPRFERRKVPYDVRRALAFLDGEQGNPRRGSLGYRLNLHAEMTRLMRHAFPATPLSPTNKPAELFDLAMDGVPEYVGGSEVDALGIIDRIVSEVDESWSRAKKVKYIRERVREIFHLDKGKYPRWIQEPEWPVMNGRPMQYVGTETVRKGEWLRHRFVDPVTGEERTVDDMD